MAQQDGRPRRAAGAGILLVCTIVLHLCAAPAAATIPAVSVPRPGSRGGRALQSPAHTEDRSARGSPAPLCLTAGWALCHRIQPSAGFQSGCQAAQIQQLVRT